MKNFDELYREWAGNEHTQDIERNIYDSAQMQDFAEYCTAELREDLAEKQAQIIQQLAEARAEIERLEARNTVLDASIAEMVEEQAALCAEDQSITELVAHKNKLIEQMKDALLLFVEGAIHDFHYVCQHRDNCLCLACQKARVKAALSAAERGDK